MAKAVADDDVATKLFASATAEQAELTVIAGQYKGKTVALGAGTVVVGRSSDCELSLKGATGASRRHCKVQYLGNRFVVIDLESRNGTIVNGQSVERKVLEQGDRIEIGDEIIQFIVHRLADLGMIDDGLSPFEETASKTLKQAQQPSLVDAVSRSIGELGNEAVTAPPQSAFTSPVIVSPLVVTPPATLSTPAQPSSRLPYVFGALAILILGGGAALIHDLVASEPVVDEATVAALTSARAEEEQLREQQLRDEKALAEKRSAAAVVVVDAGTASVAAPVAAPVAAAVVDTAPVAAAVAVGAENAGVIVRASSAGRASVVKVKVGDVVKVGDIVIVVGGDNGTMARKLQALQREEREFAEAARKDSTLSGDLESIRREMKKVAARLETKPQRSTAAGTVVEVLVKEGDVVRDAAPIVVLTP